MSKDNVIPIDPLVKTPSEDQLELIEDIRQLVRGGYDLQKLRIAIGNRVCAVMKQKVGLDLTKSEKSQDKKKGEFLNKIRREYTLITDGLLDANFTQRQFEKGKIPGGIIDKFSEMILVKSYADMERTEEHQFARLKNIVVRHPIWTEYLEGISGIAHVMTAVLISEIDIYKAEYPSSFHKYAGLDTVMNEDTGVMEGRTRKGHHLIDVEYFDKEGKPQTRKSITFNPFLKTKLIGVLGPSFIKLRDCQYRKVYDDYKFRIHQRKKLREDYEFFLKANKVKENKQHNNWMPVCELTDGHINNMAVRYMIKMFLQDLHIKWREIEGLPVSLPYAEAKLGMKHHVASDEKTKNS
ncbi:MAG: hypothetical protein DRG78_03755 [Epsilonproteobacteria bacterium]|nr:MAG: hypothetical protein DRG78_03755 [Campylobacterota bacterium]